MKLFSLLLGLAPEVLLAGKQYLKQFDLKLYFSPADVFRTFQWSWGSQQWSQILACEKGEQENPQFV